MKRLMAFIRMRINFVRHRMQYVHIRIDEKNILVICERGWRGIKQIRRYEVVDEIGPDGKPMGRQFKEPTLVSASK